MNISAISQVASFGLGAAAVAAAKVSTSAPQGERACDSWKASLRRYARRKAARLAKADIALAAAGAERAGLPTSTSQSERSGDSWKASLKRFARRKAARRAKA